MDRTDITAQTIKRSISPRGKGIDTLQLRYPRIIHAEFMTHRVFSRNASSSRAIPNASLLVRDSSIFIPEFRYNKPGMQPGKHLSPEDQIEAARLWQEAADFCAATSRKLADKEGLNVHKQWTNRMIEWFGYIDVVMTTTDWANWDYLRDHEDAQDEIAVLARAIKKARDSVEPTLLPYASWHLPYVSEEEEENIAKLVGDNDPSIMKMIDQVRKQVPRYRGWEHSLQESLEDNADLMACVASAARCCRVSFSKHGLLSESLEEDVLRFDRLVRENQPVHASPLEHQAKPSFAKERTEKWGNLNGWDQFRKYVPYEAVLG